MWNRQNSAVTRPLPDMNCSMDGEVEPQESDATSPKTSEVF